MIDNKDLESCVYNSLCFDSSLFIYSVDFSPGFNLLVFSFAELAGIKPGTYAAHSVSVFT
ncbi:hypothetical protein SynBIOSU31_02924 [Synechococcus sp. BIOS-U3-1]|nr:hypothetical protein SynBIOSU31_02924 [Synechococcus sp. BIOS-U3-1]